MRIKDPELKALWRIVRLIASLLHFLSPEGRRWLRERLTTVELRDV